MNTNTIGSNIRRLRTERGWSQARLAEEVGRTVSAVCRWETGNRAPYAKDLPRVAQVFGVDVGDLFVANPMSNGH